MYVYDGVDQRLVDERVTQFRDQTRRFMAGKLSEEEFRALRLRNGLYIQRYAPRLRVATYVHDIGLHAIRNSENQIGFKVIVGGGLGRTPLIGHVIREFLPWPHLLSYLEAILRVYNRYGRRDNIHKARIKILVKERGADRFREEVEAEWTQVKDGPATLTAEEVARIGARFTRPAYERLT